MSDEVLIDSANDQDQFEYILDDLELEEDSETDENSVEDIINTIQLKQLSMFLSNKNDCNYELSTNKKMPLDFLMKLVLSKLGLESLLVEFIKEWNNMQLLGKLTNENIDEARDIIYQTDKQADNIKQLQSQLSLSNGQLEKIRRQRDELRLHNRRLNEDNRQLLCQIRYLKTLSQSYEPAIEESKKRYESIAKNKETMKFERNRLRICVKDLENELTAIQLKSQVPPNT